MLVFCALLVQLKFFKKVRLSFLMVGHTHVDIDQVNLEPFLTFLFNIMENILLLIYIAKHPNYLGSIHEAQYYDDSYFLYMEFL